MLQKTQLHLRVELVDERDAGRDRLVNVINRVVGEPLKVDEL
jgi:hypothetical protein